MKIYSDFLNQEENTPRAVALGFFDGVHLGHQSLLAKLRSISEAQSLRAAVYTFQNAPASIFQAASFPGHLQSRRQRYRAIEAFSVEEIFSMPLIPEVLTVEAKAFLREVIQKKMQAKAIVVGHDFRFGHKAKGDVALLEKFCLANEIRLDVLEDYIYAAEIVSSTRIRNLLLNRKIAEANFLMGRPFQHEALVVQGKRLGRTLGFPTLNIIPDASLVPLPCGVYLSKTTWQHAGAKLESCSLTNVGYRPTVEVSNKLRSETYIFDSVYPEYGDEVTISYLEFIRPEIRFNSVEELRKQVQLDLNLAREKHSARSAEAWLLPDENTPPYSRKQEAIAY